MTGLIVKQVTKETFIHSTSIFPSAQKCLLSTNCVKCEGFKKQQGSFSSLKEPTLLQKTKD